MHARAAPWQPGAVSQMLNWFLEFAEWPGSLQTVRMAPLPAIGAPTFPIKRPTEPPMSMTLKPFPTLMNWMLGGIVQGTAGATGTSGGGGGGGGGGAGGDDDGSAVMSMEFCCS